METKRICPSCQKPLPPDVPMGLCPECLIKSGFATGTEPHAPSGGFTPPAVADIAALFPQLEILGFIGKGGMGAVYKARQPALDRFVALKILPPTSGNDPGFAERFNREARALARLNHPNIVAVHDFGKAGALHYLMMEFVDGANLREIQRAGRLVPQQALSIVPQICDALQFAHGEGIVHRDIKPENILLDKKGRVKITDFGIAKIMNVGPDKAALTGARDVVGTPHYMAPEQIEKPQTVDHRADIYSLGVVFYEMLTGELPLGRFAAPSAKVQVDVRLDEVVLRALEKEPERRYQQANVLKTEVETIATSPGKAGAVPASAPPEKVPPAVPSVSLWRRTPWQIWVVIVLLGLEGLTNLAAIPQQPQALGVLAKCLFITGLLLRWRPVWIAFVIITAFHVLYFLPIALGGALMNLLLVGLVASTFRRYFGKEANLGPTQSDSSRRTLLKLGAGLACLLWLPALGFGIFFLQALLSERGHWNPNPAEAIVVPLTWVGCLVLPLACSLMWGAAHRNAPRAPSRSKAFGILAGSALGVVLLVAVLQVIPIGIKRRVHEPTSVQFDRYDVPTSGQFLRDDHSAYLVHNGVDVHYVLFCRGAFTSSGATDSNAGSKPWAEDWTVRLTNGRAFVLQRNSVLLDFLLINGTRFDLRKGRVLLLHDDGLAEQLPLFPSYEVASHPDQLSEFIATQRMAKPASPPDAMGEVRNDKVILGPIFERIIDPWNPGLCALNLASGNFVRSAPGQVLDFSQTGTNSLRAAGVDLYLQSGSPAINVLTTLDMRLCVGISPRPERTSGLNVDTIGANDVEKVLSEMETWRTAVETVPIPGMSLRAATGTIHGTNVFLFVTRNDVKGVLQILDTPDRHGVKIHYRLVLRTPN